MNILRYTVQVWLTYRHSGKRHYWRASF